MKVGNVLVRPESPSRVSTDPMGTKRTTQSTSLPRSVVFFSITVGTKSLYIEMPPNVGIHSTLTLLQMSSHRSPLSPLPDETSIPSRDVVNAIVYIALGNHRKLR